LKDLFSGSAGRSSAGRRPAPGLGGHEFARGQVFFNLRDFAFQLRPALGQAGALKKHAQLLVDEISEARPIKGPLRGVEGIQQEGDLVHGLGDRRASISRSC